MLSLRELVISTSVEKVISKRVDSKIKELKVVQEVKSEIFLLIMRVSRMQGSCIWMG